VAPSVQRRKVLLTPNTGMPCSNAAKTRNPLKFAGVKKEERRKKKPQDENIYGLPVT